MSRVIYSKDELEAEIDYATPHMESGEKLHGGFDGDGNYVTPRTKYRWEAINAWTEQLKANQVEIIEATTALLTEPNFPNVEQQVFLIKNGVEQPFWDSLTITGLIEARGKALAELNPPNFQEIIVEDISATALGHMHKGLMTSHGWDEGGRDGSGQGGHDLMWFVTRDLIFGKDKYPIPTPPASIGREKDEREMEELPAGHEALVSFLMNLLMIEVRAEQAFRFYESVIGNAKLFTDKRAEAALAVQLVNRIRMDENIHVAWLRAAVSEFRSFTIKTVSGEQVSGASILDPIWEKMVHWHSVEMHEANRENNRSELKKKILATPNGAGLIDDFNNLAA
ncbi:MAG: hypothetical protein ABGY96_29310 [bacterium]|nr:hypothetical protein [Gammaproteobacteria bacterium]HIL95778.1 hypothetical protein [Pseudomonadales bacterium]